jgi:hypothetical protein
MAGTFPFSHLMKCFLEAMFSAPSALKLAGLGNDEDYA